MLNNKILSVADNIDWSDTMCINYKLTKYDVSNMQGYCYLKLKFRFLNDIVIPPTHKIAEQYGILIRYYDTGHSYVTIVRKFQVHSSGHHCTKHQAQCCLIKILL